MKPSKEDLDQMTEGRAPERKKPYVRPAIEQTGKVEAISLGSSVPNPIHVCH